MSGTTLVQLHQHCYELQERVRQLEDAVMLLSRIQLSPLSATHVTPITAVALRLVAAGFPLAGVLPTGQREINSSRES